MWRHEDVWRTLGGGINFMTGEPLDSEFAQAEMGKVTGGLVAAAAWRRSSTATRSGPR